MLIRSMSDLHLEFAPILRMIELPTDQYGVLVLAGDVCAVPHWEHIGRRFFKMMSEQFRDVIYVFGNHEFYNGGSFLHARDQFKELLAKENITNIHLLEKETKVIHGTAFVGATLWTDFMHNEVKKTLAGHYMMDYAQTYYDDPSEPDHRGLRPADVYADHLAAKEYVFKAAKEQKAAGNKVVVVVHHGISYKSVHRRFQGNHMNSAFVSELDNEVLDAAPDILIHGHVHNCFDYMIGDTRVVVNPRAYPNEQFDWDEALLITL